MSISYSQRRIFIMLSNRQVSLGFFAMFVLVLVVVSNAEAQRKRKLNSVGTELHTLATFKEKVMVPLTEQIERGHYAPIELQETYQIARAQAVSVCRAEIRWVCMYLVDPDEPAAPLSMYFKPGDDWVEGVIHLPVWWEVYTKMPRKKFEEYYIQSLTVGLSAIVERQHGSTGGIISP